jgi:hypothetical protein
MYLKLLKATVTRNWKGLQQSLCKNLAMMLMLPGTLHLLACAVPAGPRSLSNDLVFFLLQFLVPLLSLFCQVLVLQLLVPSLFCLQPEH